MTLAHENEVSTLDRACGVSEPSAAAWIAPVSDRQVRAGGSSLAALAGMPFSSRFCSWTGLSGRRYVFSVYPASTCPAFCDAILLAAVRDGASFRCARPAPLPNRWSPRLNANSGPLAPGLSSISICSLHRARSAT
jgi:hypothetical protein